MVYIEHGLVLIRAQGRRKKLQIRSKYLVWKASFAKGCKNAQTLKKVIFLQISPPIFPLVSLILASFPLFLLMMWGGGEFAREFCA